MNAKEYMNLDIVPIDTLIGYEKIDELLRKDFRYLLLFSNLKKILKKQYGRQDFCITLGTRRFWVWGFMFENCNIYVLCHGEKGTAYEIDITGDSYKAKEEALKFLNSLSKLMPDNIPDKFYISTDNLTQALSSS